MHELIGNLHMHTPYSDGMKWHAEIADDAIAAGLDFIIVTDHNIWVNGMEGYYENENGRILLLVGEEVHNVRRQPQASHFLAYGAEKELSPYAADPQRLIDETLKARGYGFLAHPHELDLPFFYDENLGWADWEVDGYSGLEIWNYMSGVKNRLADAINALPWRNKWLAQLTAIRVALNPERFVMGAEAATLALWDDLLSQGKRIIAVGGSDAHGITLGIGPLRRVIYPYEYVFRTVNTHILSRTPFNGDYAHDKQLVLYALSQGNCWVGYDLPHATKGFRFHGQGVDKGIMGDRIQLDAGATLQVRTPAKAKIELIHNGRSLATVDNDTYLTYIPTEAGAYRVQCSIPYEGKERGWIYSNPIYLW